MTTRPCSGRNVSTEGIRSWYFEGLDRSRQVLTSEPEVAQFPLPFRPDKRRLSVNGVFGCLEQLPEQFGFPGPAIRSAGDRRIAVAVERDLLQRDESAMGQR